MGSGATLRFISASGFDPSRESRRLPGLPRRAQGTAPESTRLPAVSRSFALREASWLDLAQYLREAVALR
jgi:hypothetical protein